MSKNLEFKVKIKSFSWKNYYLIIRENDFQLKKEKTKYYYTYSLSKAAVFDVSDKEMQKIMVSSSKYKIFIRPSNKEDKNAILSSLEKIVSKKAAETAFSQDYHQYKKEISKTEERNPYNALLFKLNTYQILNDEIKLKMSTFKSTIQTKLSGTLAGEFISVYNEMNTIVGEMGKQFDKIISAVNKYLLVRNDRDINESHSSSSDEEESKNKKNQLIHTNINNLLDYYNPDYDFPERLKLGKNIKCPENLIKEMLAAFTKKGAAPVYFNEPLSMCQKQCEKFFYLDLLNKAAQHNDNKPLQMCYISSFIIGEIFTNIGRLLKPFSPILGETFEYYINSKKFRYYAENVRHKPNITAFFGETPDWSYYGDTSNDTSFKFLKGSLDLTFKNKIHIIFKSSQNHYVYNMPVVSFKGLMKPPMYNDYLGTTIIEDVNDSNFKAEINFVETSWTQSVLGNFNGKVYSGEEQVEYLIGGNWQEEIYITDKDGNNKNVLLSLNKNSDYLKNTVQNYKLPFFSCNLNNLEENLEKTLPKNDSRFRLDMRFLELGDDINKAQLYKSAYEQKQRTEILDDGHKILFFDVKVDSETDSSYYEPNGKYWEMKKNNTLKSNEHNDIFEVDSYVKELLEKEKEEELKEQKKKEEAQKKEEEKKKQEEEKKKEEEAKKKEEEEKKKQEEKKDEEKKEEEKVEEKKEEKVEEKKEDKVEEKKEEKVEEKKEDKVEDKKEDKVEEKKEEKVGEKVEEKAEEKVEEKDEEKVEENDNNKNNDESK